MEYSLEKQTVERPLNVTDALSYLDDVKMQFHDQPDVYNHFLDIMKDFKSQLIDTPGVIKRVSHLFNGRPSLIQGFNAFLPFGYHIECSTDNNDSNLITVTTPTGTMMQTTTNGPGPALHWSTSDNSKPPDGWAPLIDNNDNDHSRPPMASSPGPIVDPQSIEPAIQYVRKIKERCDPDTYKQFLAILSRYNSKPDAVDEREVSAQISELFNDTPELRSDFRTFMPDRIQQLFIDAEGYAPLHESRPRDDGTPLRRRPDVTQSPPDPSTSPLKRKRRGPDDAPSNTSRLVVPNTKKSRSLQSMDIPSSTHSKYHHSNIASDPRRQTYHPHHLHSHVASSSSRHPMVSSSSANDQTHFFDRVKRSLDNREIYTEFLKLVNLFTQDYLDTATLVRQSRNFLSDGELMRQWKEILGWDEKRERESWLQEQQQQVDSQQRPTRAGLERRMRPDTSLKYGSYRKLPASEREVPCSGRDEMCKSVLNDEFVSHPSWSSEDSGFVAHKKNVYEEALHRSEEERHEYDFHIEAIVRTIAMLEPINNKIMQLSHDERHNFKLKPNLGGSAKTIHQRVIKKIYGREAGMEVVQAMQDSPASAIPVVLGRLKQKEEEWKRAQREWNRVWRNVDARNYHKSLDHQAITFKAADKKAITVKAFVNQIEVAREEQMARRASLVDPLMARTRPRHQLEFVVDDEGVFQDSIKLTFSFLDRTPQAQLSFAERRRIEAFLRAFVQLFFVLDPVGFDLSFALGTVATQDGVVGVGVVESEMNEDGESVGDDGETSSVVTAKRGVGGQRRGGGGGGGGGGVSSGGDLRKRLLKSEQAKSTSRKTRAQEVVASPSASARPSPAVSDAMDVVTVEEGGGGGEEEEGHSKVLMRQRTGKNVFFCNGTYYALLRLIEVLYSRLAMFKDLSAKLVGQQPTEKQVNGQHHFYEVLLDSCEKLFDGEIEQVAFEDQMRQMFGTKDAYKIFTVDKLIGAIIKQAQNILVDAKSQELYELLKRERALPNPTSQDQINNRRNAEKILGPDENLFRIDWVTDSKLMLVQLIGKDDVSVDDSELITGRWQVYVDSFVSSESTSFVPASKVKRPFLRKNISPALDGGYPRTVGRSGLEIKVCVRTYRMFFVSDTEEYLVRMLSRGEVERAVERRKVRTEARRKWMAKVEGGGGGGGGI